VADRAVITMLVRECVCGTRGVIALLVARLVAISTRALLRWRWLESRPALMWRNPGSHSDLPCYWPAWWWGLVEAF